MMENPKYFGRRRSIVRRIGSFLPLKPPPKIYVSVTALHSMTNSIINEEDTGQDTKVNNFGSTFSLTGSRPDLLEPISFGSEVRLLALEQELQELRDQVSTIVKNSKETKKQRPLSNGRNGSVQPPLPPPLPSPTTPYIARRASLQDHVIEERKKPLLSQKSMGNVLENINEVKLKPVDRSPGGRPVPLKRDNSPCNDLQEILRRRYIAMQSPGGDYTSSPNTTEESINDSF